MTDIAIRVENLSKQYPSPSRRTGRIGGPQASYRTLRESLVEAAQASVRRLPVLMRCSELIRGWKCDHAA